MEPIPAASFGKSHIKLIAVSIILLVTATFMRGGFTLGKFGFSKAESAPNKLTLAEAKAQAHQIVAEKYGDDNSSSLAEKSQAQLAEIDPNFGQGSVLGASIGVDGNIDISSVLNSDAISSAKINVYQTENKLQLNGYGTQLHAIEEKFGAVILLGALTTRDQASLQQAQSGYKNIISALQEMQVPAQFEEYHRMKLVYYSSLVSMADSMASEGPSEQAATATTLFFSLNEKLETLRSQLESQYGVLL